MGFGLLIIGYITVLGVLPESFIYYSWGIYIAVTGGLLMLAGFCKLEEYTIYFKLMKYIAIVYILILLGFSPFTLIYNSWENYQIFLIVSKIIRIFLLFVFHFFLLSGISALANQINNIKIEKKAKRNIYITYIFFGAFILEFFNITEYVAPVLFLFGFAYYILMLAMIYSCYMRITYKGHDEAVDEKYNAKIKKNKKG